MDLSMSSPTPAAPSSAGACGITARVVPDGERMNFLPKHFGRDCLVGESAIYSVMREICRTYNGGFWDFIELSNGGFYMRLCASDRSPESLAVSIPYGNDFACEMSYDAASIVATLHALSRLSFDYLPRAADQFHLLRDFASHHEERRKIFMAID